MIQATTIHSQDVIFDSELNGFSSVNTKYASTARNARYDAYIHVHTKKHLVRAT